MTRPGITGKVASSRFGSTPGTLDWEFPELKAASGLKSVLTYLWLVGNGGMGTIISTITTILPFSTNQR